MARVKAKMPDEEPVYNERFCFTDRFGFLIAFRPQDIHAGNAGIALKNAGKFYAPCFIQAFQIHEDVLARVKAKMPDEEPVYEVSELFKVFGDSTRARIICALNIVSQPPCRSIE